MPLFAMPSESSISKLNGSNYYEWKMLMEALLVRRGLMEYLDGSKAKPVGSTNSKAIKDFMKRSAEACAEIVLHVEISQLAHVRDPDPTAIWSTLETVHCARGFATRLMLRRKFLTLCKSDEMSIQAWVAEVRHIMFQLQEVGVDVSDEDIILALTLGLPSSYKPFIISLDTTPSDQFTLDYVFACLTNEEARQQHGRDTAADLPDPSALATRAQHRNRTPLMNITCFYCGEKGHYQSNCPKVNSTTSTSPSEDATYAF